MTCRYCGRYYDVTFLIPVLVEERPKLPEEWQSCLDCAEEQGIYCTYHQQMHVIILEGQGHVCVSCVEDKRRQLMPYEARILTLHNQLKLGLGANWRKELECELEEDARCQGETVEDQILWNTAASLEANLISSEDFINWLKDPDTNPLMLTIIRPVPSTMT